MDNDWNSTFFICDEYTKLSEDDDWANNWISEIEGPNLKEFAQIYNKMDLIIIRGVTRPKKENCTLRNFLTFSIDR